MTGKHKAPIGVFDSGVGGLTVVQQLRRLLPAEDILYFGDTARAPYGGREPAEICLFMRQILQFMEERGVKLAVGLGGCARAFFFFGNRHGQRRVSGAAG